jgi:hypothetical protein
MKKVTFKKFFTTLVSLVLIFSVTASLATTASAENRSSGVRTESANVDSGWFNTGFRNVQLRVSSSTQNPSTAIGFRLWCARTNRSEIHVIRSGNLGTSASGNRTLTLPPGRYSYRAFVDNRTGRWFATQSQDFIVPIEVRNRQALVPDLGWIPVHVVVIAGVATAAILSGGKLIPLMIPLVLAM